jgi:plastocyanin
VRVARLLPLPALAVLLALAAPAMAAEKTVGVHDDYFGTNPTGTFTTVSINPGDTVAWQWGNTGNSHTVTSTRSRSFDSGEHSGNFVFRKTFTRRERFTFRCEVHPDFMRGEVLVGSPPFVPVLRRLHAHPRSHSVKLTFRLSEKARVKVALRGAKRKTLSRVRAKGRRSITIRNLPAGSYRATLRPKDVAGNRGRRKAVRFTVHS